MIELQEFLFLALLYFSGFSNLNGVVENRKESLLCDPFALDTGDQLCRGMWRVMGSKSVKSKFCPFTASVVSMHAVGWVVVTVTF